MSFFTQIPIEANISTTNIVVIVLLLILALVILPSIFFAYYGSLIAFNTVLRRKDKTKWAREPKITDKDQAKMYEIGYAWNEKYINHKNDVHIVNDGLNLYGEYYDFGNKRCVIIMSGRTEGLRYGYFFSEPYRQSGYNVLVIDPRAHGNSDGEFIALGFEEYKDATAWAKLLHDKFGNEQIILHGICIGAAGSMYALTSENCPEYLVGMIAEGMFVNFGESFKNHLIEFRIPRVVVFDLIKKFFTKYTGYSMDYGPYNVIDKLNKPLLMLHSKEDTYSTPEFAEKLFEKCSSKSKEIVWFPKGRHSMLRITDMERYDTAIKKFIKKNFDN